MSDGYDRNNDNEGGGGGSFVMGLLTGTVLGAGLGMLFAPKSGSELRGQLSEQANNLANKASDGYRRAGETASTWADKGREYVDKARDAAAHSFLWLHAMSQIINLFFLVALGIYLWRMANPKDSMRFVGTPRFSS